MTDDNLSISELEERAQELERIGWEKQAAELREEIEELRDDGGSSTTDLSAEEVAALEEKLEWYERRGWESPAEDVREKLDGNDE